MENKISAEVLEIINARNNSIRERIERYDNLEDKSAYWSAPSFSKRRAGEIGVENFFYVGESYRSMYHDDYCTFTFFNNLTGEYEYDNWTTAAACPACDSYYDELFTIEEAIKFGLLDMAKVLELNKKRYIEMVEHIASDVKNSPDRIMEKLGICFFPKVEVSRGRKWKGSGYLMSMEHSSYSYGPSYGRGYNTSHSVTAKIFSIEDCQIHYCNGEYVNYVNIDNIIESYKNWALLRIEKLFLSIEDAMYYFNTSKIGWQLKENHASQGISFKEFIENDAEMNTFISRMESISANAFDAKVFDEQAARARRNAEQLPNIIEWVKNNTDKKDENEIMSLAIHILNKRR